MTLLLNPARPAAAARLAPIARHRAAAALASRLAAPRERRGTRVCASAGEAPPPNVQEARQWIAAWRARQSGGGLVGWWRRQQQQSADLRTKLAALGLAAVLAYGLFDGISYTAAFIVAFLGYEARTGLNPTANIKDLIKICILMWAGNNVTRPFRLAGAAALAPAMDKLMDRVQERLRLPHKAWAFALVAGSVAAVCLTAVGLLFASRLVLG